MRRHSEIQRNNYGISVAGKEKLLKEAHALRVGLAVVHLKLNSFLPISVPTEILTQIFHCILIRPPMAVHDTVYNKLEEDTSIRNIIAVSQVCHWWRAITLTCPTLWAYVSPLQLGYEWTREILTRSENIPLTLDIRSSTRGDYAILKLAMKHLHHTRALVVSETNQAALGYASGPAPLLESISFIDTTSCSLYYVPPMLYHALARFKAPALCKLVLGHNVTLDGTNVTDIRSLSHLDIRNISMSSISTNADVLQGLSSLKYLSLEIIDLSLSFFLPIITLPSLASIRLEGPASACSYQLKRLRSPSVKAITLCCTGSQAKTDFHVLLAAVSALRAKNGAEMSALLQNPQRLFISIEEGAHYSQPMVIRLAEAGSTSDSDTEAFCQSVNNIRWNPNWHMDFNYTANQEHGRNTPNDVASVCRALRLDNVTDATVQGISGPGDLSCYKQLFGQMPVLRSLTVRSTHYSSPSAIIKAILANKNIEVRALSALRFEGLQFDRRTGKRSGQGQNIAGLVKVFERRRKMGLHLPSLTLVGCTSSNQGGLENLKNDVIRMGVNYTHVGDTGPGVGLVNPYSPYSQCNIM
jgi:hypothetical protein